MPPNIQKGFTLIEVMLALFILSVSILTLMRFSHQLYQLTLDQRWQFIAHQSLFNTLERTYPNFSQMKLDDLIRDWNHNQPSFFPQSKMLKQNNQLTTQLTLFWHENKASNTLCLAQF